MLKRFTIYNFTSINPTADLIISTYEPDDMNLPHYNTKNNYFLIVQHQKGHFDNNLFQ